MENLWRLDLQNNDLTGPIPPELGGMLYMGRLDLQDNDLTGPIPPELGGMLGLTQLRLVGNEDLSGPLPLELTGLRYLNLFLAGDTKLCAPLDESMQAWLVTIERLHLGTCHGSTGDAAAYLVQAVQSLSHTVPLVAGRPALLRVFLKAPSDTETPVPPVRATFYAGATKVYTTDIPGKPGPLPTEIDEGDLAVSANVEIPGNVLRPGLEMVVEIDPRTALDLPLGIPRRLPVEGRIALDVRRVPPLELTLVPFLLTGSPDSSIATLVESVSADPMKHESFELQRTLLPVSDWSMTAHEPVWTDTRDAYTLLSQTEAIRAMEGGSGYWQGVAKISGTVRGVAYQPGWVSIAEPTGPIMVHELGHNLSLGHAPCGQPDYVDVGYPYSSGWIGGFGYQFDSDRLVAPRALDFMGYCRGFLWVSDYHFAGALRGRLRIETPPAPSDSALLLWGGTKSTGAPYLKPAFVVDAVPVLPDSTGGYTLEGRDAGGRVLFSLPFAMPEIVDGEEAAGGFVYTLPLQSGWENLASVTLAAPDGRTATLDTSTDRPMTILRDSRTGRVRAFLDGVSTAAQADGRGDGLAAKLGAVAITSRGIPGSDAWRR